VKPTRSDHVSDAELALQGLSRETDLRLDPQGRWHATGFDLEHPGILQAFSRWLERTDQGRYVLRNDLHYVYVRVEGAPLHAVGLEGDEAGLVLRLRGGEREPLRPETLRQGLDGTLYASARDGSWPVRLAPSVVLALAPYLRDQGDGAAIELTGSRHAIPTREDPLT
jgi:hypothetical protein